MQEKWKAADIKVGAIMETTFWANKVEESGFRFRATHLDGKKAPKVVLCDDPRVHAGVPCMVKVTAIRKPKRSDRGSIEVEFVLLAYSISLASLPSRRNKTRLGI